MQPRVSVPKLFRRGNRWYVRVQVPKTMQFRLRKKEYWVALGTENRSIALQRATKETQNKRIDITRAYAALEGITKTITELTDEQKVALARDCYQRLYVETVDVEAEFKLSATDNYGELIKIREAAVEEIILEMRSTKMGQLNIQKIATLLMSSNGINAPTGTSAYNDIIELCMHSFAEAKRNELARLKGRSIHPDPNPILIDLKTGSPHEFEEMGKTLARPDTPILKISDHVEKFLDNPNKLRTAKTKASIRGYMKVVIDILGDATPVGNITEADCERVRDILRDLPPNFNKLPALSERTYEERVRIARFNNMDRLSPTGVNNYIKWLTVFLGWCDKKNIIDRMPTSFSEICVADPQRTRDKRLPFTNDQLSALFGSQIYKDKDQRNCIFWVTLIALWNGMRSNEICQLDVRDIVHREDIWCFDITNLGGDDDTDKKIKTSASERLVPIHPTLLRFGFLDFYQTRIQSSKLFGDITLGVDGYYSTTFSKKSNRYLKKVGVHGPKHKFHSLRHNFRDALRRGRVHREIGKALGGWQRGDTDSFDVYGAGYPLSELAEELGRVKYPNVDWSCLQPDFSH